MINAYKCGSSGSNTGVDKCPLFIQKVAGFFLADSSFKITDANLSSDATLYAALLAAANADNPNVRIFPVHGLLEVNDGTGDPTVKTYGYGSEVVTQEGNYSWTFTFRKGGICLNNALREFNGTDVRPIFYDSSFTLFGWKQGQDMKGVPLNDFYTAPWKVATGAEPMGTTVKFNFLPHYINKQIGFYKIEDFAPESISGLQNANLRQTGVQAKPTYKVKVTTGCSGIDLFELYKTELSSALLWRATNKSDGSDITITAVGQDANIKGFTVTLDSADANYPAIGSILLNLAPISVLTAAGVTGLEGVPLTIVNV